MVYGTDFIRLNSFAKNNHMACCLYASERIPSSSHTSSKTKSDKHNYSTQKRWWREEKKQRRNSARHLWISSSFIYISHFYLLKPTSFRLMFHSICLVHIIWNKIKKNYRNHYSLVRMNVLARALASSFAQLAAKCK